MVLYYTTSAGYGQPQTVVAKSLGGYRSSNIVKNDDFDNIFGEVSSYTIREEKDEYIGLILKNTSGSAVTDAEVWFDSPTEPYGALQIVALRTATDSENNPIMERVRTRFTRPFAGTFVNADTSNRLTIGNIAINEEIGLWVKRIINRTNIDNILSSIYEKDPGNTDIYREVSLDQTETHIFQINYTIP